MKATVYWPEADRHSKLDFVGYNQAVRILSKAVEGLISSTASIETRCRLYCNIPWHHDPQSLKPNGLPLVAYTMFESTKLPEEWVKFLNRECSAALVPSQFCYDIFRLSGVKIPIKKVTLGIDPQEHPFIDYADHKGFNFLWQGMNYDPKGRKNAGVVEQAFIQLRKEGRIGDDAQLFMKYRPHKDFALETDFLDTGDNIIHIGKTIPREELNSFMGIIDCCIHPSRGEGFGLMPLENMANGRAVILNNWSFPFVNPQYNIGLDYELEQSPVIWFYKHFSWGKWGYNYNWKKSIKEYPIPRQIPLMATSGDLEYGADLKPVPAKWTWKAARNNFKSRMQARLGLFWRPDLPRHTILFEKQGYDASVKIEDLKNKMEFCYNNREWCHAMGRRASEWVHKSWNLNSVRCEFIEAINELIDEEVL